MNSTIRQKALKISLHFYLAISAKSLYFGKVKPDNAKLIGFKCGYFGTGIEYLRLHNQINTI